MQTLPMSLTLNKSFHSILGLCLYFRLLVNRPIANMATISPKRGFSVATVAKGWSPIYMLMRVRYLVVFFTLETIKKLSRRSQRQFNVLK